ncbi:MAG: hypothetical protein LBG48_04765 [Rickettsiales bacterium]|jgi:hypothetical protein|nr:hypothetical protein [Rickettsiales bacterium]
MAVKKENTPVKAKKRSKRSILINKILFVVAQIVIVTALLHTNTKRFKNFAISSKKEIDEVTKKTETIRQEAIDLEEKLILTRKYVDIWNNKINKRQKEMKGVNAKDIEDAFNDMLKNHYVVDVQLNFSPLKNVPLRDTNVVQMTSNSVGITFGAVTEYPLYYFVKGLDNSKEFFYDIEKFSIKKMRNLGRDVISDIISGNPNYIFKVEATVHVYSALKSKRT